MYNTNKEDTTDGNSTCEEAPTSAVKDQRHWKYSCLLTRIIMINSWKPKG